MNFCAGEPIRSQHDLGVNLHFEEGVLSIPNPTANFVSVEKREKVYLRPFL